MTWVHLIAVLALLQFVGFGVLVGRARVRYGVQAPATSGHEQFNCAFRVHMNTLELLLVFIPALLIAALYWRPEAMAALGLLYLLGRQLYQRQYMADPARRSLGFALSMLPTLALLLAALVGVVRDLLI